MKTTEDFIDELIDLTVHHGAAMAALDTINILCNKARNDNLTLLQLCDRIDGAIATARAAQYQTTKEGEFDAISYKNRT